MLEIVLLHVKMNDELVKIVNTMTCVQSQIWLNIIAELICVAACLNWLIITMKARVNQLDA
jgi:hypothetical protein